MKICSLLMVLFLCAYSCSAQRSAAEKQAAAAYDRTEKNAVAYVKAIDVKTLDPLLPSQGLEDWLQSGPPHIDTLRWMLDDTCDLHPDLEHDYPRCVRIEFRRGGHYGYFLILIGTLKKGIIGPPRLYCGIDVVEEGFVQTGDAERLSDLPDLLDKPLISTPVTDLYKKVVALHPKGIPTGTDKATIWPFLSGRLIQQFEAAGACQDDYARQHPMGGVDPKPAWINSGIFLGDDKRATPSFINTGTTEQQKDGSYRVSMSAYERKNPGKNGYIVVGGGIRAYSFTPDEQWLMVATVVPENDRFVVDDVRIFDGNSADSPSYLLSETFAGCDGPKWTGEHVVERAHVALPSPHYTDWDAVNALRSSAYKEEEAFAKALDVHQLDPLLHSQRLEDWLRADAVHVDHVNWNALKCNITEGRFGATPNPEGGLCVEVFFQRGNAFVEINVSNRGKGISGVPRLDYMKVRDKDQVLRTYFVSDRDKVSDSDRLSDLPLLLAREAAIDAARNLYDVVVEHHPIGIPQGDDRARINPLLSASLKKQLQDAQACQEDYLHQSPGSDRNQKPAWFNAGLFSGEGELAAPGAELIDREERMDDGSFHVTVWLSRKESIRPNSAASATTWRNWHVSVVVKAEDGRFVVDDVRIFDGLAADSPSHLITHSFAGCNGSRWVGVDSKIM